MANSLRELPAPGPAAPASSLQPLPAAAAGPLQPLLASALPPAGSLRPLPATVMAAGTSQPVPAALPGSLQHGREPVSLHSGGLIAVRLPDGCSATEPRPFYATMDRWGGDSAGRPTCKLRAVCSYRRSGRHVMVSDHMWLDGADAQRIIELQPTADRPIVLDAFAGGTRPKRGLKVFLTATAVVYSQTKAKLHLLQSVEAVEFTGPGKQRVYWSESMPKDTTSAMWHGGIGMDTRPG